MIAKISMYVRFEPELLQKLCQIWPHPKSGDVGITVYVLAKETGITQQTIHNWLEVDPKTGKPKAKPSGDALEILGKFFGILYFVNDWDHHIDNDAVLKNVKAFLETKVYGKAVA